MIHDSHSKELNENNEFTQKKKKKKEKENNECATKNKSLSKCHKGVYEEMKLGICRSLGTKWAN